MSDIKLFQLEESVKELSAAQVSVEKELQSLIEDNMELFFGIRQHLKLPRVGDDGEIIIGPLGVAGVVGVSRGQFHQMAHAPAHQPAISFYIAVLPASGP